MLWRKGATAESVCAAETKTEMQASGVTFWPLGSISLGVSENPVHTPACTKVSSKRGVRGGGGHIANSGGSIPDRGL